ncbi:porin [Brachymonas denitrificans]|uniref:Outer membrane protein (Porin) n=1 Tax=Brachymonas denitrificans DSM 15123 TaxID=1121117 RepID=A0A1H8DH31_9BURK|nr:Outer membrane protein (porin) [Brachymonas denitrificans DSM 15123]
MGAASAQSSVTLYGVADVYAGQTKTTLTLPAWGQEMPTAVAVRPIPMRKIVNKDTGFKSGGLQGSRIGVKGVEDLGNGLKAVFNYEMGFNAIDGDLANHSGTGVGFGRRAVVGLEGGFGSVLLGTDYTPLFNLLDASSVDGLSSFETVSAHIYTPRASGVHYAGNFSGVGIQAFAGYNKVSETESGAWGSYNETTKEQGYGLGVSYANGPFMVGVAGQEFKNSYSDSDPSSFQIKRTEAAVGATYDFGAAKLFANYINARLRATDGGASMGKLKAEEANIGVRVPFGAASVMAGYGHNRVKAYNGNGDQLGSAKGNDWVVGANYAFSKRTDVYARVGRTDDLKVKAKVANGREIGSYKVENVAVGLRHKF